MRINVARANLFWRWRQVSSRRHRPTPAAEVRTPRAARPARTLQRTVPCHRCGCSLPTPRPAADLPGPGRNTGEAEPLRAMAESNPLWGFPRLRRAAVRSCGEVREVREVVEAGDGAERILQHRHEMFLRTVRSCDTEARIWSENSANCSRRSGRLGADSDGCAVLGQCVQDRPMTNV